MFTPQKLTVMAVLVALGTISSHLLYIPTGFAKAFPVQHAINVTAAILLGPVPAVIIAFVMSLLRNLLGVGTILAFPGSMIGAMLAGLMYRKFRRTWAAGIGEVFGTGVLGSLLSVPFAQIFMGNAVGMFAFLPAFLTSSFCGAVIGVFLLRVIEKTPYSKRLYDQAR